MDSTIDTSSGRSPLSTEGSPLRWSELLLAVSLLIWRIFAVPLSSLWRDWILIVSVYWLFAILRPRSPARLQLLVTLMAYLLGIYVLGQFPHTLAGFERMK